MAKKLRDEFGKPKQGKASPRINKAKTSVKSPSAYILFLQSNKEEYKTGSGRTAAEVVKGLAVKWNALPPGE